MKNIRITRNPYFIFLPFLLFYIVFVLILYNKTLWGDEIRHVAYAHNLLHGFFSPPPPNLSLEFGPGYPIFMVPFIALHIPPVFINLMNAVFIYLAVVFEFKSLQKFVSFTYTLIFSMFLACYFNFLEFIALLYSESLAIFLVALIFYLIIKAFNSDDLKNTKKYIYLSGFFIGFLALTKIIFGYVLLCMLVISVLLIIVNRKSPNYRNCFFILVIALATTSPYLIYTYHLTGRILYWGTSGGNNLYWMSTPYDGEYGNWIPDPKSEPNFTSKDNTLMNKSGGGQLNLKNRNNYTPGSEDSLYAHHEKDFEEINKYKGTERDDAYKRFVIKNIKSHPLKYLQNCISNIGRIFFNYPYSYTYQKPGTLIRLPLNGALVLLSLFCLIPTFTNWKKINFSIRFMLFFFVIYLGGSIFGSAETRMFTIIVPILLIWIAYILQRTIKVRLKFQANHN